MSGTPDLGVPFQLWLTADLIRDLLYAGYQLLP